MYRGAEPVGGTTRKRHGVLGALEVIPGVGGSGARVGGGRSSRVQGWECRGSKRGFGRRGDPRSRSWLGFPTGPRSTDAPREKRPCPRPPYLRGERRHRRAEPCRPCTASSDSPARGRACSRVPQTPRPGPFHSAAPGDRSRHRLSRCHFTR